MMLSLGPSTLCFKGGLPPLQQDRYQSGTSGGGGVPGGGQYRHIPSMRHDSSNSHGLGGRQYGFPSPPPSLQSGMNRRHHELSPRVISRSSQQRSAPVSVSNVPSQPALRATSNDTNTTGACPPFYETYASATHPQKSPIVKGKTTVHNHQAARRRASSDGNPIATHLQIPSTINDSKGSLPEFASQITCFFWFESSFTIHLVEDAMSPSPPITPLVPEAMPSTGFRKWVTTILTLTQVSRNVILLALLFIYRLKKHNPKVKGKVGSEFRLLTVALMLGNKFLDDNTYTNKTWAEVSGISVQEIHVMEVEFLSNMRYTLLASSDQWKAWHVKLRKFSDYYDKACNIDNGIRSLALPLPFSNQHPTLPSPPFSQNTFSALSSQSPGLPHPFSTIRHMDQSMSSPVTPVFGNDQSYSWSRKRSLDDHSSDPPSKRLASMGSSAASSATLTPSTLRSNTPPVPKLPMPNLSIMTTQANNGYGYGLPSGQASMPVGRAMSTVYPTSQTAPQSSMQLPSIQPPNYHGYNGRPAGASHLIEYSNRPLPYQSSSATPSPTSQHFPQNPNTSIGLSPSGFPVPRASPYKPIRPVDTLLIPPPSASLHHPQNLSYEQMLYQPIGQPKSERRAGVLPTLPFNKWSISQGLPHPPTSSYVKDYAS